MERTQNTRAGEEIKRGTLMFLNFKFIEEYQSEDHYINLFQKLHEKDPIIKLMGEKHVSIANLHEGEQRNENGNPKLLYGRISTYNIIDPEAFYDRARRETVSVDLGEDVVSHFKYIDFYFSPEAHRLAFFANQPVTPKQVEKYFKEASIEVLENEIIDINFETDRDIIERIINAASISSFKAYISYSNRDETGIFAEVMESKMREDNIFHAEFKLQPASREQMVPMDDGFIENTTLLARSNGYVEATIREDTAAAPVKIITKDYPMRKRFQSKISDLKSEVYSKIMSIFRDMND